MRAATSNQMRHLTIEWHGMQQQTSVVPGRHECISGIPMSRMRSIGIQWKWEIVGLWNGLMETEGNVNTTFSYLPPRAVLERPIAYFSQSYFSWKQAEYCALQYSTVQ